MSRCFLRLLPKQALPELRQRRELKANQEKIFSSGWAGKDAFPVSD